MTQIATKVRFANGRLEVWFRDGAMTYLAKPVFLIDQQRIDDDVTAVILRSADQSPTVLLIGREAEAAIRDLPTSQTGDHSELLAISEVVRNLIGARDEAIQDEIVPWSDPPVQTEDERSSGTRSIGGGLSAERVKEVCLTSLLGAGQLLRRVEETLPANIPLVGAALGNIGLGAYVLLLLTNSEVMIFDGSGVRWSSQLAGVGIRSSPLGLTLTSAAGTSQEVRFGVLVKSKLAKKIEALSASAPPRPGQVMVTVLHSHGIDAQPGDRVGLNISHHEVELVDQVTGTVIATAGDGELIEFQVGGPGVVGDGLHLTGGGFGTSTAGAIEGAAMGIAAASVANRLFSTSRVHSSIRISASTWSAGLECAELTPEQLHARAPVIRPAHAPSSVAPSLSEELQRLAQLHRDGLLSDDEFAAAKSRILNPEGR